MSATERERLRAIEAIREGRLTQRAAAQRLGLSVRQVKRLCRAHRRRGAAGLVSRRRGRPSNRRIPRTEQRRILALVGRHYRDFGPTLAAEYLAERHGYRHSVETLRQSMIGAGIWQPKPARRAPVNRLRERAVRALEIEPILARTPQAKGWVERAFQTLQDRLVKALRLDGVATLEAANAGITDLAAANRYLARTYRPAFNAEFAVPAREAGSAFVPWIGGNLDDILCEQVGRTVGHDNCVRYENMFLPLPVDRNRCHYVKANVRAHHYPNGGWRCSTVPVGWRTTARKEGYSRPR